MQGNIRQFGIILVAAALGGVARAAADDVVAGDDAQPARPQAVQVSEWLLPVTNDDESRQLFNQVTESLAANSFDEAEIAAKQLVERVNTEFPENVVSRSRSLHNLALVQHQRADYATAILNFHAATDVVVRGENRLSENLVAPLQGLGLAYTESGDPASAIRSFDRALHISNVNEGPHSLTQVPLLESIMRLHVVQEDFAMANEVLDRIYFLYSRAFEPGSEEMLPVLYQQTAFYRAHDMFGREYMAWREVLEILSANRGNNDLSLVEPQINLGRNMIRDMKRIVNRSGPTAPSAEKYLKRALAIATNHPDADWRVKRKSLLALADYYMLLDMDAQGHRYYREAWVLLTDESMLAQRAADLEGNVPISRPHPDPYANFEYNPDADQIDPDDYQPGFMITEFTINRRGRAQDVRIVESDPPDFERMEWRVKNALKDFVYRPRFLDAEVQDTEDFRYRLEYFYRPSEYAASLAKSGKLTRPRTPETH
jgi:tetratricopeptide (TPR) repeat protein